MHTHLLTTMWSLWIHRKTKVAMYKNHEVCLILYYKEIEVHRAQDNLGLSTQHGGKARSHRKNSEDVHP